MQNVTNIPVGKIKVGDYDIRMEGKDDSLDGLRASIRRIGIIVPLVLTGGPDSFTLVAGHRRYRAAVMDNLETVPAIVKQEGRARATETSFAENLFRQDLTAVEIGAAAKDVLAAGTLDVMELAKCLGHSTEWIRRHIAILDWPADVQEAIQKKQLSVSAASNLAAVRDDGYRVFWLRNAVEQGATARVTAAWLQAWESMLPAHKAIMSEPVPAGERQQPMVPQAPCLCCSEVFRTDELSHVPICAGCIRSIRNAASS